MKDASGAKYLRYALVEWTKREFNIFLNASPIRYHIIDYFIYTIVNTTPNETLYLFEINSYGPSTPV